MQGANESRLEELLIEQATEGLDRPAAAELRDLASRFPGRDFESFERAAAAIHLALLEEEPLPARLRLRLDHSAREFWRHGPGALERGLERADSTDFSGRKQADVVAFPARSTAPSPSRGWAGWWVAAACLALAVLGWLPRLLPTGTPMTTPEQSRARLAREAADLVSLLWSTTEDPAASGASGDVVWSTARQTGFMRIQGLEPNDPAVAQYQLWIFDRGRDERFPVDGGVFDIRPGASEAIVPIDAKVVVDEPYLFAVTVERPGGVVVSSRERIVLVAQA